MTFQPLNVIGSCVMKDEELFTQMELASARGLPEVTGQSEAREGVIALIGSGPSVETQVSVIKQMKDMGTPIVGIKDAHDWLIGKGIVPDYALAIDPQESRARIFTPSEGVRYMIASQCHPAMFDHLAGKDVTIWHPYVTKGQKRPVNKMVIGGGTTSGLRAIALFYVLGWRHFALFGFDSCLSEGRLRVNGTFPKDGHQVVEIKAGNGPTRLCNASMALQAQDFQSYYDWLPDAEFYGFGDGLIQDIIEERAEQFAQMQRIYDNPPPKNGRVSFIHGGGPDMASYRYRAQTPAMQLRCQINDFDADTLIFSKPVPQDLWRIGMAKARGATIIVDICDDHLDWPHYREAMRLGDRITCPTAEMKRRIKASFPEDWEPKDVTVIPDPYEWGYRAPHCHGVNLLWFGHATNRHSLERIMPDLKDYPLIVVSNFQGAIHWNKENMIGALANADIFVLPATDTYKSANRAVEAIRQGVFVVAEPHPSLEDIPGIWIGNIKEGIEWARWNPKLANERTRMAQKYVTECYSPQTVADAWRKVIQSPITSEVEKSTGTDG